MIEEVARDLILTLTLLACIFLWVHQPSKVKTAEVPYCVVTYKATDHLGQPFWYQTYGLCSDQDIFRDI